MYIYPWGKGIVFLKIVLHQRYSCYVDFILLGVSVLVIFLSFLLKHCLLSV